MTKAIFKVWIRVNVYSMSQRISYLGKKNLKALSITLHPRETAFTKNIDQLYDIVNKNQQERKKMEKIYKLRMDKVDSNLYHDQCSPRIRKCYSIDEGCNQHDFKYISGVN